MPLTKLRKQPWHRIPNWSKCPIDAVFTWVDMNDPIWRVKFEETTGQAPKTQRYQSFGELTFSVATVKKFAPFVRRIYIVTDDQDPPIDLKDPQIRVISHRQILGPDCHRPTFKSTSIESYLHRIPDLSELFLYFNDDMCLGRKIKREDFFQQGVPITEMQPKNLSFRRLGPTEKIKAHFEKRPWERHLFNAANLIEKKFKTNPHLAYTHQMMIVRKSCCQLAWKLFPQALAKSVATPTRQPNTHTVSFIPLAQYLGILYGYLKLRTRQKSPWLQVMLAQSQLASQDRARKSLADLLVKRPHLMCINQIQNDCAEEFESFKKRYLPGFNPYPHFSPTIKDLIDLDFQVGATGGDFI